MNSKRMQIRFLYHFIHIIIRPMLKSFFKFKVFGAENVPLDGGALFMSNHASHADPVFLGAAVRGTLHYMARSTLFKPALVKKFLLRLNAFPVHLGTPDRKAIRQALRLLEEENYLLIFPEGTRSVDGTLGEAQAGVGLIAHKTTRPVIPIFLSGTQNVLPRGSKMLRSAKVSLHFGKPIDMERYRSEKASREIYAMIGEEVMSKIAELQKANSG